MFKILKLDWSKEFNTNELQTEKKEREKSDLTAKIEDLELTIKQLTEAIDQLKAEVAEMQVQLKRAGEDREKENKEFQMTVADQRATQKLLTAALNILKAGGKMDLHKVLHAKWSYLVIFGLTLVMTIIWYDR